MNFPDPDLTDPRVTQDDRKGILEQLDEDKGHRSMGWLELIAIALVVAGLVILAFNLPALAPFGGE